MSVRRRIFSHKVTGLFFILLCLLFLGACPLSRSSNGDILILAVDGLSVEDVNCQIDSEEVETSGFQVLCSESVRFTHAYTTSVSAVPALASILTGKYPFQHGVRHNGGSGLGKRWRLASQAAHDKGYRTAFFSGGPPVWRKSGLNQGFELYEDNIVPRVNSLHRPVRRNFQLFVQWLEREVGADSYFSLIFVPDIQFLQSETRTRLGSPRARSRQAQLEELDDVLFDLIEELKSKGRWDKTAFFLVGLKGSAHLTRQGEIGSTNLYSENAQVAMLMKPSQKRRDLGLSWKVDANVSIADIGRTLFDLIEASYEKEDLRIDLRPRSLLPLLVDPDTREMEDRVIITESGWGAWRENKNIRYALRFAQWLYIHDQSPRLYNSFSDRLELMPLPLGDRVGESAYHRALEFTQDQSFAPSTAPSDYSVDLVAYIKSRWLPHFLPERQIENLSYLERKYPDSSLVADWSALKALRGKDWERLRQLGRIWKQSLWVEVAEYHLARSSRPPRWSDPCFQILGQVDPDSRIARDCHDELFMDFTIWVQSNLPLEVRERARESFLRQLNYKLIDRNVSLAALASSNDWDVVHLEKMNPMRVELALSLPLYSSQRDIVLKRVPLLESFDP